MLSKLKFSGSKSNTAKKTDVNPSLDKQTATPNQQQAKPSVTKENVQTNRNTERTSVLEKDPAQRIQEILTNSCIKKYLEDTGVTDLNFDGVKLRVQHNVNGFSIDRGIDEEEIKKLAKQIADEQRKAFNSSQPILDTEFGFIRVNAIHESASPDGTSLSLRVSRPRLAVTSLSEMTYGGNEDIARLLDVLIKAESNIIIAGRTGSGKTETQKMLVGSIENDKVIALIEDTRDSHIKTLYPDKFIYSWQTLLSEEREKKITMSELVKASLRSNPDWVIISETRGAEAADILDSVKTDHAIITTIHAKGAMNIPARLVPMVRQAPAYSIMSDVTVGREIVEFLRFGIYMHYTFEEGKMVRRIKEIVEFTNYSEEKGAEGIFLYRHNKEYDEKTKSYQEKEIFNPLSEKTLSAIKDKELIHLLPERFKGNQ